MADDLGKLYSAVSQNFDIGDSTEFRTKMATPEGRRRFFDKVSESGFDLGNYDDYEKRLAPSTPSAPPEPAAAPRNIWREGILNRRKSGDPSKRNADLEGLFEMAKAQRRPGTEYGLEEWLRQEEADGKPLNRGILASAASELQNLTSGVRRSKLYRSVDALRRGAAGALVNPSEVVKEFQQGGSIYDYGMKKGDEALDAANAAAIAQGQSAGPSTPITEQLAQLPGQVTGAVGDMVTSAIDNPRGAIEGLATELLDPENYLAAGAASKLTRAAGKVASKVPLVGRPLSRLANVAAAPNPLAEMGAVNPGVVRRTAGHLVRTVPEQVVQGAIVEAGRTGDVTAAGVAANLPIAAAIEGVRGIAGGPKLPRSTEPPATVDAPAAPPPGAAMGADLPAPTPDAPVPLTPDVPPVDAPPAPEPLAPPEPAPEPVRPTPAPRIPMPMRRAMRRESRLGAAEQATKTADQTRAAESSLQRARRDADRHAKGGNQEFAAQLIDDAKEAYTQVYGEAAVQHMEADKALLASKKKSKLPAAKPVEPKTMQDAVAIVEKAKETVATGTPEEAAAAVEQAKPALEALHPVGEDAKVAAAELEATPKVEPPAPPAPDVPSATEAKAPIPDYDVRPKIQVPTGPGKPYASVDLPSPADWVADPVEATATAREALSNNVLDRILEDQSPRLGAELKKVKADMADRADATIETAGGPVTAFELAEDYAVDYPGENAAADLYDPAALAVDDYAAGKGLTRADIQDARTAVTATPEERAVIDRVVKYFARTDEPLVDPARTTKLGSGLGGVGDGAISQFSQVASDVYRNWFERISDEFNRLERYARDKAGPELGDAMRVVNTTIRKMNSEADIKIGRLKSKLDQLLRTVPESMLGIRKGYLETVTDALEGRPVKLDPVQEQIRAGMREILDELGKDNEAAGAAPMRQDYFPRVEERSKVNDAINGMEKELKQQSQDLQKGTMTLERARGIKRPSGKAGEIVDHYSEQLQKLFTLDKEGRAHPTVDENGRPVVGSESAYLLMMDPEGTLDPMLPELFEKVEKEAVTPDGKIYKTYTVEPSPGRPFTPEEYKQLMDAEAVRILANRADYDPDAPRESHGLVNRTASWQVDGSLQRGRLLPAMPDEFYDRNPINVLDHIIPRQTRGAARIATYGKDKAGMLQQILPLTKVFDDAELGLVKSADGTYRLAGPKDPNYKNGLARSLDDVAMGYIRPFTPEIPMAGVTEFLSDLAKFKLLLGRIASASWNEVYGAGAAATLGPKPLASYAASRTAVAGMQAKSRLTRLAAGAVRSSTLATPKGLRGMQHRALQSIVGEDPLNAADMNAMSDAAMQVGASRGRRFYNAVINNLGTFSGSTKGMDIAAHLSGYNLMLDMLDAANRGEVDLAKKADPLTNMLHSNLSDDALRHARSLVGNGGRPVSQQAARDLMALGNPFIGEYKSILSGNSGTLFSPKMMRSRWARGATFLMSIPLSIQVGQLNALRNATGPKLRMAGALGVAGLTGLAAQYIRSNPQAAAVIAMMAAGNPGPMVMTAPVGGYDPDASYAEAQWAATSNKLMHGSIPQKLMAMGASTANGMAWTPRAVAPEGADEAELALAGIRGIDKGLALKLISLPIPGIVAGLESIDMTGRDLAQAGMAASQGRVASGGKLALGAMFPQVREAGGKQRARIIGGNKLRDMSKIEERNEVMQGPAVQDLIRIGVQKKVGSLPGRDE